MNRQKKLVVTAHCVLNQNAVVREWERAPGAFNKLVKVLLEENVGILQLPCPEMAYLGEERPPKTKEEYDTPPYRVLCQQLPAPLIKQLEDYDQQGYQIIGLLGISQSPSCDTLSEKGIFMEELMDQLEKKNIRLRCFDVPESYLEGEDVETELRLKAFLRNTHIERNEF